MLKLAQANEPDMADKMSKEFQAYGMSFVQIQPQQQQGAVPGLPR